MSLTKNVLIGIFGYCIFYFGLLGFNPTIYRYYLRYYRSLAPTIPANCTTQITEAKEVFNIHAYNDMLPYLDEDIIIFRNFTNCAEKFEKVLYPRHKDKVDSVELITFYDGPGNVFFPGVNRTRNVIYKTLKEILNEKSFEYFPAFLQLFDNDDYRLLLNADNSSNFLWESTFITHFMDNIVTTPSHGDQGLQSLAIQCYGTRSFLFNRLTDLRKNGFMPVPIINGAIMRGTPDTLTKIPTVRAIIHPNDVLYFPPMYYHAVATLKGKNMMFSVRKRDRNTIKLALKASPAFLLLAILRLTYKNTFYKPEKKGFYITKNYMPFFDEFWDEIQNYRIDAGSFHKYDGLIDFGLPN